MKNSRLLRKALSLSPGRTSCGQPRLRYRRSLDKGLEQPPMRRVSCCHRTGNDFRNGSRVRNLLPHMDSTLIREFPHYDTAEVSLASPPNSGVRLLRDLPRLLSRGLVSPKQLNLAHLGCLCHIPFRPRRLQDRRAVGYPYLWSPPSEVGKAAGTTCRERLRASLCTQAPHRPAQNPVDLLGICRSEGRAQGERSEHRLRATLVELYPTEHSASRCRGNSSKEQHVADCGLPEHRASAFRRRSGPTAWHKQA